MFTGYSTGVGGLSRSGESQSMSIPEEEAAVASLGTQSIQSFINTQTQTSEERALPALRSLPCKGSQRCPCLWVCGLEVLTRLCPSEQYTFSSGDFSLSRGFLHWSSGYHAGQRGDGGGLRGWPLGVESRLSGLLTHLMSSCLTKRSSEFFLSLVFSVVLGVLWFLFEKHLLASGFVFF